MSWRFTSRTARSPGKANRSLLELEQKINIHFPWVQQLVLKLVLKHHIHAFRSMLAKQDEVSKRTLDDAWHWLRSNFYSCRCVYQLEDSQGIQAVQLTKDIVKVAAVALQKNLTLLAPLVLPYSELLRFLHDAVLRKLRLRQGIAYQPDFRKAFQHFSLHAGLSCLFHWASLLTCGS